MPVSPHRSLIAFLPPCVAQSLTLLGCLAAMPAVLPAQGEGKRSAPRGGQHPAAEAEAPVTPTQIGGIRFAASLEEAHALSARDGKPVIAYFTFDT